MRRLTLLALVLLAGAPLASAPASAQGELRTVTIQATEGSDCPLPEERIYCFVVTEGDLEELTEGERVSVTFENTGQLPHNLFVANISDADPERTDTAGSAAFANTTTIAPGESTQLTFRVPTGVDGIYLWCDLGSHEEFGMWLDAAVEPAPGSGGTVGNGTTDGDDPGSDGGEDDRDGLYGIPAPGALVVAGATSLAALAVRRRRS